MRMVTSLPIETTHNRRMEGFINDPDLDGSFQINKGLCLARQLLCDLTNLGVPVGSELLDTVSPSSWLTSSPGALSVPAPRSLSSTMSSLLVFPSPLALGMVSINSLIRVPFISLTLFYTGTDGSVGIAVDAMKSASHPHAFMGVTEQSLAAIVKTTGNEDVHAILRGSSKGPNYDGEHVMAAAAFFEKSRPQYKPSTMINCFRT